MSNADGGVVVAGVADRTAGPAAIIGTDLEAEWLRERIWELTTPRLAVDVRVHYVDGVRILVLVVPRGHRVYRCGNRVTHRVGTSCVEMTPEVQRSWEEQRFGYDWSAELSERTLGDVTEAAVERAREYLRATGEDSRLVLASDPTPDLLRKLGVLRSDHRQWGSEESHLL